MMGHYKLKSFHRLTSNFLQLNTNNSFSLFAIQSSTRRFTAPLAAAAAYSGTVAANITVSNNNVNKTKKVFSPIKQQQTRSIFTSANLNGNGKVEGSSSNGDYFGKEYKSILLNKPLKHVAHIQLNKPKSKNAFGLDTASELIDVLDKLDDDATVRVILLSGNGPDFTSGIDLKSSMSLYAELQDLNDVARKARLLKRFIQLHQEPFKRLHRMIKPMISVQHGLCLGLGMELGACCDIRYCSRDTKLSIREVLIGIAADVGSLQLMPKLVSNQSLLRELIYTGRYLTVEEALRLGYVSEIFDSKEIAIERALEVAKLIASRSPLAVQGSKQNLRFSSDKPFEVGLDYNAIWNMCMMQGEDVSRAIGAIISKDDSVDYEDF